MEDITKIKNIAIIRLSAMGDVAMSVFVIRELRKKYEWVHITMLTTPFLAPFFADIEGVTVFPVDFQKQYVGIKGLWKLYRDVRKIREIDTIIDLHDVIRTKILRILFRLSFCRVFVIDKGRDDKKALCRGENRVLKELKRTVTRYADVLAKANLPIELSYKIEPNVKPLTPEILEFSGEKTCRWIGIAPFAQHQGKIYPLEQMERVIELLLEDKNNNVFLFGGGKSEREITEKLEQKFENCVSMVGKIKLAQEMILISNLDCMVSMDSSAAHMASLAGIRAVSIWGATHPYAGFLAYGQSMDDVVSVELDCRPCSVYGNKPCLKGNYECMTLIKPEDVVSTIVRGF